MEAICPGVPILAWPMMAEQPLNARMVVEEIKIGLRVETVDGSVRGFVMNRAVQGSTVLHSASARGQIEVVKYLIASFDISTFVDSQGNTALHVAAYRGHLAVVEVLIGTSPSLASLSNYYGDTFLHMAVAGFRAPGFRRVDKQIELIKQLVCGDIVNIQDIVNVRRRLMDRLSGERFVLGTYPNRRFTSNKNMSNVNKMY